MLVTWGWGGGGGAISLPFPNSVRIPYCDPRLHKIYKKSVAQYPVNIFPVGSGGSDLRPRFASC